MRSDSASWSSSSSIGIDRLRRLPQRAQHLVGRVALAVHEPVGRLGQPLARRHVGERRRRPPRPSTARAGCARCRRACGRARSRSRGTRPRRRAVRPVTDTVCTSRRSTRRDERGLVPASSASGIEHGGGRGDLGGVARASRPAGRSAATTSATSTTTATAQPIHWSRCRCQPGRRAGSAGWRRAAPTSRASDARRAATTATAGTRCGRAARRQPDDRGDRVADDREGPAGRACRCGRRAATSRGAAPTAGSERQAGDRVHGGRGRSTRRWPRTRPPTRRRPHRDDAEPLVPRSARRPSGQARRSSVRPAAIQATIRTAADHASPAGRRRPTPTTLDRADGEHRPRWRTRPGPSQPPSGAVRSVRRPSTSRR